MDQDVLIYITRVFIIFLILPIHEYAHAWAAHKLGDDTAKYQGRLTLNPLAHVDIVGALLLLFTGFGWAKPVPVNPLNFSRQYNEFVETKSGKQKKVRKGVSLRGGMAITAAAGPISNLIFAFISMIIFRIISTISFLNFGFYDLVVSSDMLINVVIALNWIFYFAAYINIGLAIFNLIPIPPLDGSKILGYFTSAKVDRFLQDNSRYLSLILLLLICTNILSRPLNAIINGLMDFMVFCTDWIPTLLGA